MTNAGIISCQLAKFKLPKDQNIKPLNPISRTVYIKKATTAPQNAFMAIPANNKDKVEALEPLVPSIYTQK